MKLLIIFSLFFNLNFVQISTLNSKFEKIKDYGLNSTYNSNKVSVSKQFSMFKCIAECNKNSSCNVAIYSKKSSICELYLMNFLTNNTFEYKLSTFALVKKGLKFSLPTRLRL